MLGPCKLGKVEKLFTGADKGVIVENKWTAFECPQETYPEPLKVHAADN